LNHKKQSIDVSSWEKFRTNLIIPIKQAASQEHEYAGLDKNIASAIEHHLTDQKHIAQQEHHLKYKKSCKYLE